MFVLKLLNNKIRIDKENVFKKPKIGNEWKWVASIQINQNKGMPEMKSKIKRIKCVFEPLK
jgi:hypothetical protein